MKEIMAEAKSERAYSMLDPCGRTPADKEYDDGMEAYFERSMGTNMDKLRSFAKFVPRQTLGTFLAKIELFKLTIGVHGYIIECGVYLGAGLMTWANLSAILEPYNHTRRIIGFDTFAGDASLSTRDEGANFVHQAGSYAADSLEDLIECLRLFDLNRPIGHIPRVELVAGDATMTIPAYTRENKHAVVAMLYLDFGLYEPTKAAIEHFLPRMPKGAIIAFDELSQAACPGETLAALDTIGLRNLRIRRFPYATAVSYAVLN
jgi:hypothetical protein